MLFFLTYDLLYSLIVSAYYTMFLKPRFSPKYNFWGIFLLFFCFEILVENNITISFVGVYVIFSLIVLLFFFKNSIPYIFFIILLFGILLNFINVTVLFLISKIIKCSILYIFQNGVLYFWGIILCLVICLVSFVFLQKLSRLIANIVEKYIVLFDVLVFILYLFNYYHLLQFVNNENINNSLFWFILFCLLELLVFKIMLIICSESKNNIESIQIRNDILRTEYLLNFYKNNKNNYSLLKHDVMQLINNLYSCVLSGNNEEVLKILDTNKTEFVSVYDCATGIAGVDCVMIAIVYKMNELNIDFTYFIDKSCIGFVEEYDLAVILSNLLSNAIENVDQDYSYIELEVKGSKSYVAITVSNTVDESDKDDEKSKLDNRYHGLGLKSLNKIADKYNGSLITGVVNGKFKAQIRLINEIKSI